MARRTYQTAARAAQAEQDAVHRNDAQLLRELLDLAERADPDEVANIYRDAADTAAGLADAHQPA